MVRLETECKDNGNAQIGWQMVRDCAAEKSVSADIMEDNLTVDEGVIQLYTPAPEGESCVSLEHWYLANKATHRLCNP